MRLLKTALLGGLLGFVAQIDVPAETKSIAYPATVAQSAERFLGGVQADVSSGIQSLIGTKVIGAKDLDSLVLLLNSSTLKLREAGYDEKLARASQQVESVNTQMAAALRDPGNKEVFATGLEPEKCLEQIRLQKAAGVVLEKKLTRLKSTVEELRKANAILEPVTPAEQLTDRIKLRLSQLLREWNQEFGNRKVEEGAHLVKDRSTSDDSKLAEPGDLSRGVKPLPTARRRSLGSDESNNRELSKITTRRAVTITPAAAMILKMSQEKVREKTILKHINNSSEPFRLITADQILYLRTNNVSSPAIVAMLERDTTLAEAKH
jgi:hypothetical protein